MGLISASDGRKRKIRMIVGDSWRVEESREEMDIKYGRIVGRWRVG